MTTENPQSDIAEVRDQLSLDFAEGEYLNRIGNNLGLRRSSIDTSFSLNFDDNTWRALIKVVALQYKQILTKFEGILEIVIGPKITQVGTFSADIALGVNKFTINEDMQFPQVGTLILDEGLATEETVEVCFIDRVTHTVFLTALTVFAHQAEAKDAEQVLALDLEPGDTEVYIPFSENFPTADFPYTLVLGRGTANEEVVQLTANDLDTNVLTISAAANSHAGTVPSQTQSILATDYVEASYFLNVANVEKFSPEGGTLLLGASDNQFTATGGSTTTAVAAASTFSANRHVRSIVIFDAATTTALLQGVEAEIIINTDTTLTFLTTLPAAVASGDLFNIRPVVEYVSINTTDNALNLRRDIVDVDLVITTAVEDLRALSLVSLAPVKMEGKGWDIFQIDSPTGPPTVEILLPEAIRESGDIPGNSYLHTEYITPVPATTLAGAHLADATIYAVASNLTFPTTGVLILDDGGGGENNIGYSIDYTSIAENIAVGATSVTLDSGGVFFELPAEIMLDEGASQEIVTVTVINGNVATIGATSNLHLKGSAFRAVEYVRVGVEGSPNVYTGGETVTLYEPRYAGLSVLDGDLWDVDDVWPGPYVYNPTVQGIQQINQAGPLVAETHLDSFMVSGPTKIMITQQSNKDALEVEDASAFPNQPGDLPFSLEIGIGSPNPETINVQALALKQRTYAILDGTQAAGTTTLLFDNLDELDNDSVSDGSSAFPDADGYRVRIGEGTGSDEILFVIGASGATLTFSTATQNIHVNNEVVRLMADVLHTSTPLTDVHEGAYEISARAIPDPGANLPGFDSIRYTDTAEIAQPAYGDLPIAIITGLPLTGSNVYFNFGDSRINRETTLTTATVANDLTLVCDDTSDFPATAGTDYPYIVTVSPGTAIEEKMEVSNNNATTTLTLPSAVLNVHPIGAKVTFTPSPEESLAYNSVLASTIVFSPADVFNQTHYAGATLTVSPGLDIPQITGYDFPLIMPSDLEEALKAVLDLVRAAGVLVTFIDQP